MGGQKKTIVLFQWHFTWLRLYFGSQKNGSGEASKQAYGNVKVYFSNWCQSAATYCLTLKFFYKLYFPLFCSNLYSPIWQTNIHTYIVSDIVNPKNLSQKTSLIFDMKNRQQAFVSLSPPFYCPLRFVCFFFFPCYSLWCSQEMMGTQKKRFFFRWLIDKGFMVFCWGIWTLSNFFLKWLMFRPVQSGMKKLKQFMAIFLIQFAAHPPNS